MNGCKKNVKYAQLCKSDSLRIKYALQWASFEKEDAVAISRLLSSDMQLKKEKEIEYREAQGYKYIGGLTAAKYYMDDNEYKTFVSEMKSCSDPQYDYTETVQLFVKTVTQESVGELLQTHWHQSYPFNVDAPNGFAGCVPIAVAQIAYYHKYPNKYDWSKIAVKPTMNDAFSFFIKDIRNLCEVEYNPDGTASNYEKARNAFAKLGYTVKKAGTPTCDKLREQILSLNPVYMQGLNSNSEGHAWVCDGYKNLRNLCIATLIPNPKDPRFRVEEKSPNGFMAYGLYLNAYPSDAGEYLHVNLGWGGDSDGWYYRYMYVSDTPEHYKNKQLMLTVKK